ncbi:MAG TPA: hypothetical protein VF666_00020 [Pyrinomonadaceae bacterium]|jgi:hypothetical protein
MKENLIFELGRKALLSPISIAMLLIILLVGFSGGAYVASSTKAAVNPNATANAPAMQVAALPPWTAVGSTGVVDEAAENIYAFGTTNLTYLGGSTAPIVARYNVTNTFDNGANPNIPGWTILEAGSTSPAGTTVTARLFRVTPCTGVQGLICTATNAGGGGPGCKFCQFPPNTIDFSQGLYYVEVTLTRTSTTTAPPSLWTLRIY